ncbi:MAG: DUF948 domain-containing protein [Syntrophaceae bacterium]|nr:DUF948 domain-containing protein [Syntrophaceae bacterium]
MESNGFSSVAVIVLIAALVLLVVVMIPCVIQIWRSAKEAARTLALLNKRLPGIMGDLEEITAQTKGAALTVGRRVEELSLALERVRGIVAFMGGLETLLRIGFRGPAESSRRGSRAIIRGVSAFLVTLLSGRSAGRPDRQR